MFRWTPRAQFKGQPFHNKRLNYLINERFQWRYTRYLVSSVFFASVITGGVTGYFLNQNYDIFNRLALLHAPDLLPQLEREQVWINTFLFAFVLTMLIGSLIFGLRMTSRIAGPLMILKRHFKSLSWGMFFQRPIRVRDSDEFGDLIESYNYFYRSLQTQIRKDLKVLYKVLNENDQDFTREELKRLVEEKQTQLTTPFTETSEQTEPSSESRHVS